MRGGKKRGEEERISTKFPIHEPYLEVGLGFDKPERKKSILINIEMGNIQRDPETIENCTWKI